MGISLGKSNLVRGILLFALTSFLSEVSANCIWKCSRILIDGLNEHTCRSLFERSSFSTTHSSGSCRPKGFTCAKFCRCSHRGDRHQILTVMIYSRRNDYSYTDNNSFIDKPTSLFNKLTCLRSLAMVALRHLIEL